MSEAKECVGGRIVQMMHDPPATLMNPHDARAETHTLCQGRRPPAHGSHCYRPEAAGTLCGRAQAEGRLRAHTLRMTRPEAAGMLCGQGPGRRPATISHTDGRRPQAGTPADDACAKRFRFRSRPSFMWCSRFPVHTGHRFLCCVFVFCVAVETAD
mgnify:CR=1 FL=1